MDTKASTAADTSKTDNLNQSLRNAAYGLFSLPSLGSLTLMSVELDESFYTGVADAASLSQVGDGLWQIYIWAKPCIMCPLNLIKTVTARYSEGSNNPKVRYSEGSLFRMSVISKVR